MSKYTIHYDINYSWAAVSLISMASVVQTGYITHTQWFSVYTACLSVYPLNHLVGVIFKPALLEERIV